MLVSHNKGKFPTGKLMGNTEWNTYSDNNPNSFFFKVLFSTFLVQLFWLLNFFFQISQKLQ